MSGSRFSRCDGIVHRWVGDKVLVLRPDGTASTIAGVAAVVWEVTDGSPTTDEIERATRDLAPDDGSVGPNLHDLVVDAVRSLVRAGLLVEHGSG